MTRETKIGLLIGVALILLVSVVITDYLSVASREPAADLTTSGQAAEESVLGRGADSVMDWLAGDPASTRSADGQRQPAPVPTPQELAPQPDRPAYTPAQRTTTPRIVTPPSDGPIADADRSPTYRPYRSPAEVTPPEVPAEVRRTITTDAADNARSAQPIIHRVKPGENLYMLAEQYYGNGEYWHSIAQANADIDDQTGRIIVGQRVVVPNFAGLARTSQTASAAPASQERAMAPVTLSRTVPTGRTITVERGDTLYALAREHLGDGNQWRRLLEANRQTLPDAESLRPGMTLVVPGNGQTRVVSQPSTSSASAPPTRTLASTTTRRSQLARPTLSSARFVQVNHTQSAPTTESVARPSPFDAATRRHTVEPGESLASIARRYYGDPDLWPRIYQANRQRLTSENVVPVGTVLIVPGP